MWKVIGAIVLLVAIIGGISRCVSSPERADSGEIVGAGTEAVMDIRYGDCLQNLGGDSTGVVSDDIPVVPCTQPHIYEVFGVTNSTATSFDVGALTAEANTYCDSAFLNFVGIDFNSSTLGVTTLTPTDGSWADGDREITCLLKNANETAVTGSYEGSGL